MILLKKGQLNKMSVGLKPYDVCSPCFLFQFTQISSKEQVTFVPENITNGTEDRYYEFQFIEGLPINLTAQTPTTEFVYEGQYWVKIFQQGEDNCLNLDPDLSQGLVWEGRGQVEDDCPPDLFDVYESPNEDNSNIIYLSDDEFCPSPTPTASITPTITPTSTITPTITPTNTPTPSITSTITPSVTPTITPTTTSTPTTTPTLTPSITASLTPSISPTTTPSITPTNTPSVSPSVTPTMTPSVSPSLTPTNTSSPTPTPSTSGIPNFCVGSGLIGQNARGNYLDGSDLYIFGSMEFYKQQSVDCVFKVDKNSGAQQTFQPAFPQGFSVTAIEKKSTGDWYMTGTFDSYSGQSRNRLVKLQPDLYMAPAFNIGIGLQNDAYALHYNESTDRLFIGGAFVGYNGDSTKARFIKIDGTTGAIDTSIPNTYFGNGDVRMMVSDGNGNLFLGGTFTTVTGTTAQNRLVYVSETNGYRVPGFNIGTGPSSAPTSAVYDGANNRLYMVGQFNTYNGTTVGGITCLNTTTGAIVSGFTSGSGFGGTFGISITQLPGGDLVILHNSATYNGVNSNRLTRVTSGGTMDTTFNTNLGSSFQFGVAQTPIPFQYQLTNDGTYLYITGNFISYQNQNFNGLLRLNLDGTLASTINC